MKRWLRVFAPAVALAVVLAAAFAAMGSGRASARRAGVAAAPQAQPPAPTAAPTVGPNTDTSEQQDGRHDDGHEAETNDEMNDQETADDAGPSNEESAEAAVLAGKATISAEQARAAALAANPGATVVKVKLDDENGTIIYSVELNTGADVKVDAQSGIIIGTDRPGSDEETQAGQP